MTWTRLERVKMDSSSSTLRWSRWHGNRRSNSRHDKSEMVDKLLLSLLLMRSRESPRCSLLSSLYTMTHPTVPFMTGFRHPGMGLGSTDMSESVGLAGCGRGQSSALIREGEAEQLHLEKA
jgi:hypothetical protein